MVSAAEKKNMHHKLRKGPQETLFGKPVLISKFIIAIYSWNQNFIYRLDICKVELFTKITLACYLIQHPVELIPSLNNTLPVIAVHNKNETLRVLEVVPPQGPDLFWVFGTENQ